MADEPVWWGIFLDQTMAISLRSADLRDSGKDGAFVGRQRIRPCFWLSCLFVFGSYLRTHYLFQPNFLDIFFWTLMAYGLVRYVQSEGKGWLYLAGISMGLGMLSKYSMLFFAISLLAGLLLTPQRRLLLNRHCWYALGVGFLLFLPNLLWQWKHGFPVVYYMNEPQRTPVTREKPGADFLFSADIDETCPVLLPASAGYMQWPLSVRKRPYRFIAWAFAIVLIPLAAGHAEGYWCSWRLPGFIWFRSREPGTVDGKSAALSAAISRQ